MTKYFSLNNKHTDLCYNLLFYFTIAMFHYGSKYILWNYIPDKKETTSVLVAFAAITFFYLIINPAKSVNVLQDNVNNAHYSNP